MNLKPAQDLLDALLALQRSTDPALAPAVVLMRGVYELALRDLVEDWAPRVLDATAGSAELPLQIAVDSCFRPVGERLRFP